MNKWKKRTMGCLLSVAMLAASAGTAMAASDTGGAGGARCTASLTYSYNKATAVTTCSDPENVMVDAEVTSFYLDGNGERATKTAHDQNIQGALEVTATINERIYQILGARSTHKVINGNATWMTHLTEGTTW